MDEHMTELHLPRLCCLLAVRHSSCRFVPLLRERGLEATAAWTGEITNVDAYFQLCDGQ